jgi:hypothetical protein
MITWLRRGPARDMHRIPMVLGLRPTVFYRWQKEFFENGAAAFQAQERPHRQVEEKQKRIACLEKKVQTKDEVLDELMASTSR